MRDNKTMIPKNNLYYYNELIELKGAPIILGLVFWSSLANISKGGGMTPVFK